MRKMDKWPNLRYNYEVGDEESVLEWAQYKGDDYEDVALSFDDAVACMNTLAQEAHVHAATLERRAQCLRTIGNEGAERIFKAAKALENARWCKASAEQWLEKEKGGTFHQEMALLGMDYHLREVKKARSMMTGTDIAIAELFGWM